MKIFVALILSMFLKCAAESIISIDKLDKAWYERKVANHESGIFSPGNVHVLRLAPNEDLIESLWRYARVAKIKAGTIVSTVGSLQKTNIRFANNSDGTESSGSFEIVSLVGNIDFQKDLTNSGEFGHIHISVSDELGATIGGHLLSGNIIYTTAEITLIEIPNAIFDRELDDGPNGSGYKELKVFGI